VIWSPVVVRAAVEQTAVEPAPFLSPPVMRRTVGGVVAVATLKEVREPLRLIGAEPDDSAWLSPWFFERVAHVSDHRLRRRLPDALERSPTLPGRFQAGGRMLCTCDQLRITHRAIPLMKSFSARL
jgi:hypothetical protein